MDPLAVPRDALSPGGSMLVQAQQAPGYQWEHQGMFAPYRDFLKDPAIAPYTDRAARAAGWLGDMYSRGDPQVRQMIDDFDRRYGGSPEFHSSVKGQIAEDAQWNLFVMLHRSLLQDAIENEDRPIPDSLRDFMMDWQDFDRGSDMDEFRFPESVQRRLREQVK